MHMHFDTIFSKRFGKFWQMQPMWNMNLLASETYRIKAGIPLFGSQFGSTNPYHLTLHSVFFNSVIDSTM